MESHETIDHRVGIILNQRYKILERIAAGASGVVYRAELIALKRKVAVKFLHALFYEDNQMLGRFEREAQAMSKLSHPFCVSVIDYGIEDAPYIVMDFVEGETLRDALDKGRFEPARAIRIAQNILAGIGHAHSQGIIHRDIKPANIQISQDQGLGETIRIFDFGLAKLLDSGLESNLSEPERIMGTPVYMSPEQAVADEIDSRTDLYSIGIVLFEMLTGAPPFLSEDKIETIRMRLAGDAPGLSEVCTGEIFSFELEKVVATALARNREHRFANAREFSEDLSNVPETSPVVSDQEPSLVYDASEGQSDGFVTVPIPRSVPRKHTVSFAGLAMGLALFGTALIIWGVMVIGFPEFVPSGLEGRESGQKLDALAERAEAHVASGQIDPAIDAFILLRRSDPNNSFYIFRLANLFFQKKWWGDSIEHYEETLRIERSYAGNTVLIQNLIEMLQHRRLGKRAYRLILKQVGNAALPQLEEASRHHKFPIVRQKARKLIDELSTGH